MPVPKRRQTHTRGHKRKANWKAQPSTFSECPQCHQMKMPHQACPECGYYKGREVVDTSS